MESGCAVILVRRRGGMWRDHQCKYVIYVDGRRVGKIEPDGDGRFPVTPGHHDVHVRMGYNYLRSPKREVDVAAGHEMTLTCQPRPSAEFLDIWWITFGFRNYIVWVD